MSTIKTNNAQIGQSATPTDNMTWYQPASPDGTVRLGVGNSGATTADVITVHSDGSVTFSGAVTAASFVGAGLILQSVQTSNFTAAAGNSYPVNTTSGAVTVTLPASPTAGQQVQIIDYAGTAATNAITINPNGGKINGVAANATTSTNRASNALIYVDSTQGWVASSIGNAGYLPQAYSVSYLIIGGGGSGGKGTPGVCWGGGGGGGGLQNSTYSVTSLVAYSVVIGAGGAGSTSAGTTANGGSSSVFSVTSGGGLGGNPYPTGYGGNSGTPQSNTGRQQGPNPGGGGASAAAGGSSVNGAAGASNAISGSTAYYTGGGGSGGDGTAGAGGTGGGGSGASSGGTPSSGTANTGGGGGGMRGDDAPAAGSGGSGIVIISYAGAQRGTGGTVTSVGGNTIHTFTSSGSYTA